MTEDGRDCYWGATQDQAECEAKAAAPTEQVIACGAPHAAIWGITGYDTPGHWCNEGRVRLEGAAGGEAPALAWEEEDMPEPRGMLDAVMLPDGRVVLLNGAKVRGVGTVHQVVAVCWWQSAAGPASMGPAEQHVQPACAAVHRPVRDVLFGVQIANHPHNTHTAHLRT
jgi:hypothetical protein